MIGFPPLVSRLIPSLGRDNDNEVVTTVRAIGSALRNAGQDFHDLARAVEGGAKHRVTSASPALRRHPIRRRAAAPSRGSPVIKPRRRVATMTAHLGSFDMQTCV